MEHGKSHRMILVICWSSIIHMIHVDVNVDIR